MLRRSSSAIGLVLLVGCHPAPAAPIVQVSAAPIAAPVSSAGAAVTRKPLPAQCPDVGLVRRCRTHPDCLPPWGTTHKEQDCHRFEWVSYSDAMSTSVDDPCDLLRMASLLDAHLEVNAHYKRTLPAVVAAEAEYRRTSIELSAAAKALARALRTGGATLEMARGRFLTAIPAHEQAAQNSQSACGPEPVPF